MARPVKQSRQSHRLRARNLPTLRNWGGLSGPNADKLAKNIIVECGWGRLIFAHSFASNIEIAQALREESEGKRDIAFYLRDPHVVLALAPQELFLDPSHAYRLQLGQYRSKPMRMRGFTIRKLLTAADIDDVNRIYASRGMVQIPSETLADRSNSRAFCHLVAEDTANGNVIATVMGLDHVAAFDDPENGSSFWCLAVDPQASQPGVGEALVRHLIEHFSARGRDYLDLSVMHNNLQAIALYEKLGFQRVPVFALKRKSPFNEPLFIGPAIDANFNPYARIIVNEARRRGIAVEVLDAEGGYFALSHGGRRVVCRESLSEMTSAIAMSRCADKAVTLRLLRDAGLPVPDQQSAASAARNRAFLQKHKRIVVKPSDGEQGAGISVDIATAADMEAAVEKARQVSDRVLLEQFVAGDDLRIVVIDYKVVAAALRKPARIVGNGRHTVRELIAKQSRRRAAATGGESRIPLDAETERCVRVAGYDMDSVLPVDEELAVRRTANLHTGGTIHDVTAQLHPALALAAERAARALDVPVTGLDLMVKAPDDPEGFVFIEANERPGLANHEPQPTAERFVDFLFPQTIVKPDGGAAAAEKI
ncbi:MAG: N-acetylglutaminylglutamine synthetase [Alphaproteobacteria bacterium]